jgi:hypothetical protein
VSADHAGCFYFPGLTITAAGRGHRRGYVVLLVKGTVVNPETPKGVCPAALLAKTARQKTASICAVGPLQTSPYTRLRVGLFLILNQKGCIYG